MSEPLKTPKDVMPITTAWLFDEIRANPLLNPFILIGGTGLSLHIGHRISEDLDFITLRPKLPRAALVELQKQLEANGHQIEHRVNPAAYEDFQIAGMELADSQQDWVVDDTVKLTFFAGESQHTKLLANSQKENSQKENSQKENSQKENRHKDNPPTEGFKIASFQELCQLKAIVTAKRSKSRDWLDLFILERDHQFGIEKWKEAFDQAGLSPLQFELALNRMCEGNISQYDEGYESLLQNPPTIKEIQNRFQYLRKSYETSLASSRGKEMGPISKNPSEPEPPNSKIPNELD